MCTPSRNIGWVNSHGDPIESASTGPTAVSSGVIKKVVRGDALQPINSLRFRDPHYFRAGELHDHTQEWENSNDFGSLSQHSLVHSLKNVKMKIPNYLTL